MTFSTNKHLPSSPTQSYLRDWIYGGIDGTITTFAVVAGVVGGQLSPLVILILGFANLIADGFSMAVGNYLGTKSEVEQFHYYKQLELAAINKDPVASKAKLRELFLHKGLGNQKTEELVKVISQDNNLWVETILKENYGFFDIVKSPIKAGFFTFCSFLIFGVIPLVPYVIQNDRGFLLSCVMTGLVFIAIGSVKSVWSTRSWLYSGLETLIIGSIAASLAYSIGYLLHHMVTRLG